MLNSKDLKFKKLKICILTISSSRNLSNDKSGNTLEGRVKGFGHELFDRKIVTDDKESIKEIITRWSSNESINVIITTGGTGLTETDVTPEALEEIFEKKIPGFSIIFHKISFEKIKTSTIQSRATAGILMQTLIFALPGSPNAVKDGWDDILKYQLDSRHKPCNFVEILPRLKES
jgi:molybdenum cofactor biosynthesis protein B|tara:strand:- start:251 stop:778 length:528 start_codon:yes stop_codon:yes gene_type:complete